MATIREGNQAVLLVVDMQAGVMRNAWQAEQVVANAARTVERAREAGIPVIWVQHADEDLPYGTPEWEWVQALVPAPGETRIHKNFNSSFERTTLEDALAKLSATHIVLAGASTNWCIRATAYGALDRGYDLTLIEDAHTTKTIRFDDGRRIEAANIVEELNIAITWLSYPDRKNGTAKAEQVDFTAPGGTR